MGTDNPTTWAATVASDLLVGGEHVPFERVLSRHLEALTKLRVSSGLTWPGIANILVRAGARRSDGTLITADQIRVGYARLSKSKVKDRRPQSKPSKSSDRNVRAAKSILHHPAIY